MGQCTATSKRTGERCKRFCAPGKKVCKWHGGASNGAPKGSKNALKHGAYEKITRETMFADEVEYADSVDTDPASVLEEQLRILKVKELRIARRMKEAMLAEQDAGKDDGTGKKKPSVVTLTVATTQTKNFAGEESKTVSSTSETFAQNYLRLEQAHTTVLAQIGRTVALLADLRGEQDIADNEPPVINVRVVNGRRMNKDAERAEPDPE
mgnify:FL=1